MVVYIDKEHLEICDKISEELNKRAKSFNLRGYAINIENYEQALFKRNLTLEAKKKLIINNLHKLLVMTFAVHIDKIKAKKQFLTHLKNRLSISRNTILKLRDINYYLKTIFIKELKLEKASKKRLKSIGFPFKDVEGYLQKSDLDRLEATVYRLIGKIIFLDQKLLKKYKIKELKLLTKSRIDLLELEKIIARQAEILRHLEAKLPPADKFKPILLKKKPFTEWVSRIFALLAAFEYEYKKEQIIFNELKKDNKLRKRINMKINYLVKEKFAMLKLKEKRLLTMVGIKRIEQEHHISAHNYASALKL